LTSGITIPLSEKVSMVPNVGYSMPYGDLKKASDGGQKNQFYGGVTMNFSF
jgi:hypothetical protein